MLCCAVQEDRIRAEEEARAKEEAKLSRAMKDKRAREEQIQYRKIQRDSEQQAKAEFEAALVRGASPCRGSPVPAFRNA